MRSRPTSRRVAAWVLVLLGGALPFQPPVSAADGANAGIRPQSTAPKPGGATETSVLHLRAWFSLLHRLRVTGWVPEWGVYNNGFDPELNVATVFTDITGYPLQAFNPKQVLDVKWLRMNRPELSEQLDAPRGSRHVWVLSRFSASAQALRGLRAAVAETLGLDPDHSKVKSRMGTLLPKNHQHAEIAVLRALGAAVGRINAKGLEISLPELKSRAFALDTDRFTCRKCAPDVAAEIPNADITYRVPYGDARADELGSPVGELESHLAEALEFAIRYGLSTGYEMPSTNSGILLPPPITASGEPVMGAGLFESRLVQPPCRAGCEGSEANGVVAALTDTASSPPRGASASGGIDFSSLELRYVALDVHEGATDLDYGFRVDLGRDVGRNTVRDGISAAVRASDAFFVWLALARSAFWVNLNPNEPDRIIDRQFGRTDAGRILLQADLLLKKTVGRLIHPRTRLGGRYWRRLRGREKCVSMRQWIVPGPATVRDTGDELFILRAPLRVKMETQYLRARDGAQVRSCRRQSPRAEEHNEKVYRRLILPRVEKRVNHAPGYAALRRVYLSRIAAEWVRDRSQTDATAYDDIIDSGDIDTWVSHRDWRPMDTFRAYVHSYKHKEWRVKDSWIKGNRRYTQTYVYGGVNFANVDTDNLSAEAFERDWPGMARRVADSLQRPVTDPRSRTSWLGGTAVVPRTSTTHDDDLPNRATGGLVAASGQQTGLGTLPVAPIAVAAGLVLIALALALHRRGRTST